MNQQTDNHGDQGSSPSLNGKRIAGLVFLIVVIGGGAVGWAVGLPRQSVQLAVVCILLVGAVVNWTQWFRKGRRENIGWAILGFILATLLLASYLLETF